MDDPGGQPTKPIATPQTQPAGSVPTEPVSAPTEPVSAPVSHPSVMPPGPVAPPPRRRIQLPYAPRSFAALTLVVAGILLTLGPFLAWLRLSLRTQRPQAVRLFGKGTRSVVGVRLPDGRITLGLGIAVLLLALVVWAARSDRLKLPVAVAVLAAGVVATTLAVASLVLEPQASGLAEVSTLAARGGGRVAQFLERGITVSKGVGLWISLIGGALAVLTALTAIVPAMRRPDTEPPDAV